MDKKKIEKIHKVFVEKPELHVRLIEALEGIYENVGEPIEVGEVIEAIKMAKGAFQSSSRGLGSTHIEFWSHYMLK
jgi:hypothetical protein